jgi:mono/diheme cytochrome c family protein
MSSLRTPSIVAHCLVAAVLAAGCAVSAIAADDKTTTAAAEGDAARGRLLYETHCVACHTTEAHWREKHLVKNQGDLVYQVTRWQKNAGQNWSSEEIGDVAAYLNATFYKLK